MNALEMMYRYMEAEAIQKGDSSSWWTEKGDANISINALFEIRESIRRKIEDLNLISEFEFLFECKIARRHGIDVRIENFDHQISSRKEPYQNLKQLKNKVETYMGGFVRSLIRDYNLPASIYIILKVINEGGDYYSPSQKIEFEVLEEIN